MIVDPLDTSKLFVAIVGQGVYRSSNAGVTWFPTSGELTLSNDGFDNDNDGIDINNDGVLDSKDLAIVGDLNGDGQVTFADINVDESDEDVTKADRIELAYHSSSQGGVLYAALLSTAKLGNDENGDPITDGVRLRALFRSSDQGAHWRQATNLVQTNPGESEQGSIHFAMVADPIDPYTVYLRGTTGGYKVQFDPGPGQNDQWVSIMGSPQPHPDTRDLVFLSRTSPDDPLVLLEADDGGVYARNLQEGGWESLNNGLRITEFYSVAQDLLGSTVEEWIGGTQDNGVVQRERGLTPAQWESVLGGDGNTVAVDNSGENSIRYVMANNLRYFYRRTYNSNNEFVGSERIRLTSEEYPGQGDYSGLTEADRDYDDFRIFPFVLNSVDSERLLLGGIDGLYESTTRGNYVTNIIPPTMTSPVAMAYGGMEDGVAKPEVAYVTDNSGQVFVRETVAGGFNLKMIDADGDGTADNSTIRDIVVHPDNWRIAYVVDENNVFMTEDAGESWDKITGTLSLQLKDFRTITMSNRSGADIVWVGGLPKDPQSGGVFAVVNPETNKPSELNGEWPIWHPYGDVRDQELNEFRRERLPSVLVTDLHYEPQTDTLTAATFGRGVWVKPLLASITVEPSTIRGTAFQDMNGDRKFDAGVDQTQDVTIFLDLNHNNMLDSEEPSIATGMDGTYEFPNLPPGRYSVRQQDLPSPGDWLTVSPQGGVGEVVFSSFSGGGVEVLDFANSLPASIQGTKFEDINGNGVQDAGEVNYQDWLFFIDTNHDGVLDAKPTRWNSTDTPIADQGTGSVVVSQLEVTGIEGPITDVNVTVHIQHPRFVRLDVQLVSPSGTVVTLASPRGFSFTDVDDYANTMFDDEATRTISYFDDGPFLGRYQPQTVLGTLDGQDANGVWQLQVRDYTSLFDINIASWTLDINTGEQFTRTDSQGAYRFGGLPPGTHSITEATSDLMAFGVVPVNPFSGIRDVTVMSGDQISDEDFANAQAASIQGVKFLDSDQDGVRDPDTELGLEGWQIYLDLNENGVLDSNPSPRFSSVDVPKPLQISPEEQADGEPLIDRVRFPVLVRGLQGTIERIRVSQDFSLDDIGILPPEFRIYLRYGEFEPIPLEIAPEVTLEALVGDDPNEIWYWEAEMSDGSPLPRGVLNSWSIEFDLLEPTDVTDSNGNYQFTGLRPGEYQVREVIPDDPFSCWVQTTPDNGFHLVSLSSGDTIDGIDFGNIGCGLTYLGYYLTRQTLTHGSDIATIGVAYGQIETTYNGRTIRTPIPKTYMVSLGGGDDEITIDGAIFEAGVRQVIIRGGEGTDHVRMIGNSSDMLNIELLDEFDTLLTFDNGLVNSRGIESLTIVDPQKNVNLVTADTTLRTDAVGTRQTFVAPNRASVDMEVDQLESALNFVVSGNTRLELGGAAFTRAPRVSAGPQPEPPLGPNNIVLAPFLAGPQPEPPLSPVEISGFGPEDRISFAGATGIDGTPLPTDFNLSFDDGYDKIELLVVYTGGLLARLGYDIMTGPMGASPAEGFVGDPTVENHASITRPVSLDQGMLMPLPVSLRNIELLDVIGSSDPEAALGDYLLGRWFADRFGQPGRHWTRPCHLCRPVFDDPPHRRRRRR